MIRLITLALLFFIINVSNVEAQQVDSIKYKSEFGFRSDNDVYIFYLYFGQDQYYTNGLFLSYKTAIKPSPLNTKIVNKVLSIHASQEIYNPISGYAPQIQYHDRPFAASLYGSLDLTNYYKNNSIINYGIDLGQVGPSALGKEAQELLHKTIGYYEVAGWEYQIKDSFLAQLRVSILKNLGNINSEKFDWTLGSSVNFGTIHNNANLNLLFRAGKFNKLINSTISNGHLNNHSNLTTHKKESFFYLKPQISYVLNNGTMEGNLFKNTSPVTYAPMPWLLTTQIGYQLTLNRFRFDYNLILKTKEIKSNALPHQYGSISFFYLFNKN